MGSGEGDAIREIAIPQNNINNSLNYKPTSTTTTGYYDSFGNWNNSSYGVSWNYPITIYKYQIKCPAPKCKTNNWLELDKITGCTKCGSLLKAVSQVADYEVTVEK